MRAVKRHAEEVKRIKDVEAKKHRKAARKAQRAGAPTVLAMSNEQEKAAADKADKHSSPVAFVFPGQGSQAVGMLQVSSAMCVCGQCNVCMQPTVAFSTQDINFLTSM